MQYTYEALGRILSLFHHHACPQWRREADIRSFISFVPRREYEARKETGISRQKEEMQKYRHKGGGKKGGKEDIVKQKTQSDSGHACCFFNLPKYRHVTVMYNIKKLSNPVINREKKKKECM